MMPRIDCLPDLDPALVELFEQCGLVMLGVSGVALDNPQRETHYREWLADGGHGEMAYLERHAPLKFHPERILPGCQSVLIAGLNYYQDGQPAPGEGRVARYAWGRDYHKVLGKRLKQVAKGLQERYPGEDFKGFTDAVPLDERTYAEQSGAGFVGRNTLLINGLYGSWFLLGEILSTRLWPPSVPADEAHGACPSGCRKCLQACPTGALTAPGRIDARRCISYLTIEYKGVIPVDLRRALGDWIFGCDRCQEVCPFQLRKRVTQEPDFRQWRAGPGISLAAILAMTEVDFKAAFAGSPVMRAGWRCLQRNACVAAGNTRDPQARAALECLAGGADELLREHARWALEQYEA